MLKFLIACLVPALVHAGARTDKALTSELKEDVFKASLSEGFHFNEKAPNMVTLDGKALTPTKISGRELEFAKLPTGWESGRAQLYICDDALTFCESSLVELKTSGKTSAPKPVVNSKAKGKVNAHGFIEDDFQLAIKRAEKTKKLILVDFAARWCPGCIRLEKETFHTKDFQKMTKDMVRLKLDTDRFENVMFVDRYNVRGIPTLIVLNSKAEEIDRLIDYQPIEVIKTFLADAQTDPSTLEELKANAKDQGAIYRLGRRLLNANRYKDAIEYLEKVEPLPPEIWTARVNQAQWEVQQSPQDSMDAKKKLKRVLKEAIAAEPNGTRSLNWRLSLMRQLKDEKERLGLMNEGVALAERLLKDPEQLKEATKNDLAGEFTGYERFEVAIDRSNLIEEGMGEKSPEAKAAAKMAGDIGLEAKMPLDRVGANMRLIATLLAAEEHLPAADKLTQALLRRDPKNPELQRRRLRVLVSQRRYAEAIPLGEKVIRSSYGRNEFYAAQSLAKAYIGAKKSTQAKDFINQYLSRNELNWPNMKSVRKELEDMRKDVM